MIKYLILALGIALGTQAHAQTSTLTSASGSAAQSILGNTNVIVPPANTGAGQGLGGATWVMGQTTGGNNVTSYDACLKNAQVTVLFAAVAVPLEISHCWALRNMDAIAKYPPGSVQYNLGCKDSDWLWNDWDTGTMACTANKAKLAKQNPNDPRAQAQRYVPVVQAGHGSVSMTSPVPTVVPVDLPRCSAMVRDRCRG